MRRDARKAMLAAVLVAAVTGGVIVYLLPERARELAASNAMPAATEPVQSAYPGEVHERFQQAVVMLHAGQPQHALTALERVLALAPDMPEARVNAGFALYELSNADAAREQFRQAIDLRASQVNAYYGLALSLEALDDLDGALGAMRTYLHLADAGSPHIRKARAAIWEWRSRRDALVNRDGGDKGVSAGQGPGSGQGG